MLLGGAFRGAARCVTRRARPRALFDDQGEQCLNQSVCVRGPRGRLAALWAGQKMSTAQLYTW